jgi:hypothetical protein
MSRPANEAARLTTAAALGGRTAPAPALGSGRTALSGAIFTLGDRKTFVALQATLPGPAGVAVSGIGRGQPVAQLGPLNIGVAWSTAKVPVVLAALAAGTARPDDVDRALHASDNQAAMRLWATLGRPEQAGRLATAQVRAAGVSHTVVESRVLARGYTPFGQTLWSLADQARFMAGLVCTPAGPRVLAEMHGVVPAQRWGLGTVDAQASFKGGWGPGTLPGARGPWLDRQMGVVHLGSGTPVAVAIAVQAVDGNHRAATAALSRLAAWVAASAHTSSLPRQAACR